MLKLSLQSIKVSRSAWLRMILCLAGLALCVTLLSGCGRQPPPLPTLPGRTSVSDPAAAQDVLEQIETAVSDDAPLTITISEHAANALVAPYLAGTPVDGLTLWFEPDRLLARMRVVWRGDHIVLAAARVSVAKGQYVIKLDAITVDGIVIPAWIRESAAHAASDALSDATLPLAVDHIALQEGVMVLTIEP